MELGVAVRVDAVARDGGDDAERGVEVEREQRVDGGARGVEATQPRDVCLRELGVVDALVDETPYKVPVVVPTAVDDEGPVVRDVELVVPVPDDDVPVGAPSPAVAERPDRVTRALGGSVDEGGAAFSFSSSSMSALAMRSAADGASRCESSCARDGVSARTLMTPGRGVGA